MTHETKITIRLPKKDADRLREEAKESKLGFSKYIRKLLNVR